MAAQAAIAQMTDEQLEKHAFAVLSHELGLVGYARFLRLYGSNRGDYTADRHQWLDGHTVSDLPKQTRSHSK
jgi:hypothetical protein